MLFHDVRLAGPTGVLRGWLRTDGARIAAFGAGAPPADARRGATHVDGAGGTLMPGFVDVHVHGSAGHTFMDADPDELREMAAFFAAHGVTSFLATTWSAGDDEIRACLAACSSHMTAPRAPDGARMLGVHLEGPYVAPARAGAQDPRQIRDASRDEALAYLDRDVVRLVTLAPERPGSRWLIDECRRRGVTVGAGHTAATYDEMAAAVARGVSHLAHTFNAMGVLHHREPGVVGAALTLSELRCELIADGVHVHPAAMRVLFDAAGTERLVLVTDAVGPAGLPDGEHALDGRTTTLRDGRLSLPDGTLAGSVLTFDQGLRNLAAATGRDIAALWRCSSANAALSAGVADRKGTITVGRDADLVLLDDDAVPRMTVVEGAVAYDAR